MSHTYSVFYLIGGSSNFVCKSVTGRFTWEQSQVKVNELISMGYKSMAVRNGHIVGGYCSYTDFNTKEQSLAYYNSL